MDLGTKLELQRRYASEALEGFDKQAAKTAIDAYLHTAFLIDDAYVWNWIVFLKDNLTRSGTQPRHLNIGIIGPV